jgi:hypothetical protein
MVTLLDAVRVSRAASAWWADQAEEEARVRRQLLEEPKNWALTRLDGPNDTPGVDVVIWSASRPSLCARTLEAFRRFVQFSGRLRYFLCEDLLDAASLPALQDLGVSCTGARYAEFHSLGHSMTDGLDRFVTAPYLFFLEDDEEAVAPLPLDAAVEALERYPHLNQITFGRRKIERSMDGMPDRIDRAIEVQGAVQPLTNSWHWHFLPSVWRLSFLRPRWIGFQEHVHLKTNWPGAPLLPGWTTRPPAEWYADVLGSVLWGAVRQPPFFRHLGGGALSRRLEFGGT